MVFNIPFHSCLSNSIMETIHMIKNGAQDGGARHQVIFIVRGVHVPKEYRESVIFNISFFVAWLTVPA